MQANIFWRLYGGHNSDCWTLAFLLLAPLLQSLKQPKSYV